MEERYVIGSFRKIIFSNSQTNYYISLFKLRSTNCEELIEYENKTITVTGVFHEINEEDKFQIFGEAVDNPRYGLQFNSKRYEKMKPEGKDGLISFLSSDLFSGVGEKTAIKIVEILGENCLDVIANNYLELLSVPTMTEKKASQISSTLEKYNQSSKTIVYLTNLGFNMNDAIIIYNLYLDQTSNRIENDIYSILDDTDKISFHKLDEIARSIGVSENDEKRLLSLIIFYMKSLCFSQGDTYLIKDEIYAGLNLFDLIDSEKFDYLLIKLNKNGKIMIEDDKYFLKEFYEAENNIAETLLFLTNKKDNRLPAIKEYIDSLQLYFDITYNDEQKSAIKKAIEKNLLIITGGPGTGKTTIIKAICELYKQIYNFNHDKLCESLVLLAPTGRAAKRMSEATMLPAMTIHRFLKWNKETNEFAVNLHNKSNAKFVIIDEVSMIDTSLLSSLLHGLSKNVKLIFIGDYNQLESVNSGKVLKDLIDSEVLPVVELDRLYRQNNNSYIASLASEIKHDNLSETFTDKKDDYNFFECNNYQIKDVVKEYCQKALEKDYTMFDIQVLIPMYKGENGIDNMNKILQEIFNPKDETKNEIKMGEVIYREFDKILQLENRVDDNVFNGDVGIIESIEKGTMYVDFYGNIVKYTPKDYSSITHAYAVSVHKAQGSEFKVVIMPITCQYKIMLYKKIIYTGITRAKKSLILVGDKQAFCYGISNKLERNRKTFLKNFIIEKSENA